jgi:class 3 adenylate cyclase
MATLAADVVGYSSLIGADKEGTLERLEAHRRQFVYPKIAEHNGHIAKETGDSLLVEFASPAEAVQCAIEVQRGMIDRNLRTAPERRIAFSVGVNIGDAKANGDDLVSRAVAALSIDRLSTLVKPGGEIYGNGASTASGVAALAAPAGICISGPVRDAIRDELPYKFEAIEKQDPDIGAAPAHCYAMSAEAVASTPRSAAPQVSESALMRLRRAAVVASAFAMVGIWAAAFWAYIGANSSMAPMTPGSHISAVGNTAVNGAQAPSPPQGSPVSSTAAAAGGGIESQSAPQPQPVSNAAGDRAVQAASARPTLPETAAEVRAKLEPLARPTLPDSGPTVVRGNQAPSSPTLPDSGPTVVRGNQATSAPTPTPDSGTAVVRGNRAPSSLQTVPDSGAGVVRGTRAASGPPFSLAASPLERSSGHPGHE